MLIFVMTALAYTVEGPSFSERSDAAEYAKTAKGAGHKGRIVRRFKDGSGWEFVVRFEAGGDQEAKEVANAVSAASKTPAFLFDDKGKQVSVVQAAAPGDAPTEATVEPEADWMEAILDRHGAGRAVFSEAERVKVVFDRTLADGRVARHVYARRGTDLHLKVEAVEGEVTPSRTLALADKAWLITKDGATPQDLQRARETIARFGPASLVPVVLDLRRMTDDHPTLRDLKRKGTANVDEQACQVFESRDGDALIAVGDDGLIRRLAIHSDHRVIEFRNYVAVQDVEIPHQIQILIDGKPDSTVKITSIELDGELDEALFALPK